MIDLAFHHIGIACHDLSKMRSFVRATHPIIADSGVVEDPRQQVSLCLLTLQDGMRLELVSGDRVRAQIRRGITYYHNCYEVEDIEEAIIFFEQQGCKLVVEPVEAILFGDRRVAFLMSPMGLLELLER